MLMVMYFICSCEVRRTPIDLIERESELVSRFNTEFSGGEFVRFFLREYLGIIILLVMVVSSEIYMFLILYGEEIYGSRYLDVKVCGVVYYIDIFGVVL